MNLYTLHAMTEGDRTDARRMRYSTSHETFSGSRFPDARALQHRMRAGIGLSPAEYAEAFDPGRAAYEQDVAQRPRYHDGTPRKFWHELGGLEQWSWQR